MLHASRLEENSAVRAWSESCQKFKGDRLVAGYVSRLPDYTCFKIEQNNLQELKEIWNHWDSDLKKMFFEKFGDIIYLLDVQVNKPMVRAFCQFWNPAYSCFTVNGNDLTLTVEEYTALFNIPNLKMDRIYSKPSRLSTLKAKLIRMFGVDESWTNSRIKKKGNSNCVSWFSIRDLMDSFTEPTKKMNALALSIYGLVIFPKVTGYIEEEIIELIERLVAGVNPAPAVLAETFRSLNFCRRNSEGRFIGCPQLLQIWIHSHLGKAEDFAAQRFQRGSSPIREYLTKDRLIHASEDEWMTFFRNISGEDILWKAPWLFAGSIIYRCGEFDWVPLLGLWGAVGYVPLMVSRQYGSIQFVPVTYGLNSVEFEFEDTGYRRRIQGISTHGIKFVE